MHATLTTLRRHFPLLGAGVFFLARCLQDPALVATPGGLVAVLVGAAIVYVVLAGLAVLAMVARRVWTALSHGPYYTPDTKTGSEAEHRGA